MKTFCPPYSVADGYRLHVRDVKGTWVCDVPTWERGEVIAEALTRADYAARWQHYGDLA